jgi:type VI secretion system secreted protein Hcp
MGRLQIASIAVASILVAAASFASAGGAVGCQALPEMHYADAANVDYFLKIEGVDGESTSEKHKGEIEILSYSWGVSQQGGGSVGGGGAGAGKATFQDFTFVKNMGRSSPLLFVKAATGEHIKEVVLTGEVAGKRGQKFMEIKMSDVLISSYQQAGRDGGVPTDSFSLNLAKIEFKYYPADKSGALGGPVAGGWDLKQNMEATIA